MKDLIYRQDAIDAICSVCGADNECDKSKFVYDAPQEKQVIMCPDHYELTHLPSAQLDVPDTNVGTWEERSVSEDSIQQWQSARCSVCNKYHTTPYLYYFDNFNYCPNCGAKMEVTK